MRRPRAASRAVLLLVALAIVTIVLPGCRGDGNAPGSPQPRPERSLAAPTSTPAPATPPLTPSMTPSPTTTAPPARAEDPAGLAAQLAEAERRVRDTAVPAEALARDGHLQQSAYRLLARRPEWREQVLALLPDDVRDAARANADAVRDLVAMITPLPPGSRPSWRIVAPRPAAELLAYYREAADEHGVGWEYLAAIHLVETRLGRIKGTSSAGAMGPMQFMPGTWAQYGEGDVHDDRDAIRAAARYLKAMGAPGDMDRALRRYNNSARYVRAIQAHAAVLRAEPVAYRGYHHWQVHYLTQEGDLWLPEGYPDRPAVVPP